MEALRLTYDSSISDIHSLNSSFDVGTLQICYSGANRNKTYFSKSTLERGIPTIFNCPVVVNYRREDGGFGGHDLEVINDYDGELRVINVTQPVGVIPESANIFFKEVEEENGDVHEYLCADVILWRRQEAYKAIKENGIVAESMEINVKSGSRVEDIYVVDDFEFTAFTLLGTNVEPCFESASLQTYSIGDEFKTEFAEMMNEFKESFNLQATPEIEGSDTNSEKGGCRLEDKTLETFENTEEVTEEVVFEETTEEEVTEVVEEVNDTVEEDFALNSNLSESIHAAFADKTIPTEWGEMPQYCICDYDVESKMIYAWDAVDWLLYGFSYEMDGDVVAVDFDTKRRMKYVIAEFDEGDTQDSPFASAYEQMTESTKKANENISDLESKYNAASEQMDEMNTELNDLRQFKIGVEAASDKAKKDELLAQFADLSEVEEFAALVADASSYELDALEEKCYAIRGRNVKLNFSNKDAKAPKLAIESGDRKPDEKEPYGGVVAKYLHK